MPDALAKPAAALLPHAPALLPGLSPPDVRSRFAALREAIQTITFATNGIVIVSPHARRSGIYRGGSGSLDGFGVHGITVDHEVNTEVCSALAAAWGRPVLDDGLDHGIVVPLLLATVSAPIVAVGLREVTGTPPASRAEFDAMLEDARSLAAALESVAAGLPMTVVASANTSAGLTARGPLTELPSAGDAEARLTSAIETGYSSVRDLVESLWSGAGSCAAGPLFALSGVIAASARGRIVAHNAPLGVGHLVALWGVD